MIGCSSLAFYSRLPSFILLRLVSSSVHFWRRMAVMALWRRPMAVAAAAAMVYSGVLLAQKPVGKDDKKQDEQQKKEVQNVVKLADDLAAGQSAQNDLALTWV